MDSSSPSQHPRYESRDQVGLDNMDWAEDGYRSSSPSQQLRYESRDQVGLDNMD